ncbi:daunorubicin/doxorubicin resistance ABC transporter ATP-binding protein DrrA, partial [Streptomyces tricolor]
DGPGEGAHLAAVAGGLCAAGEGTATVHHGVGLVCLPLAGPGDLTAAVHVLTDSGVAMDALDTHTPSLDEVFLTLTGGVPTEGRTTG